ncbi:MAG: acyltransferase [Clostridium sp.]|nr:acyltransferase [Clostridium sp.]
MNINTRDYKFDNLKALLIICVIIGNSLEYANPTILNVHYFILVLYIFHMPMFTFISGYFNNKSSRTTQKKVVDTLKIYILAQIFYFALNKMLGDKNIKLQLFTTQWTMWYFLSLTCFYIISDYIKDKKKWFIFSILTAIYIGFDNSVGSYGSISRTFFFLPFFISGMSFKNTYMEIIRKYKYIIVSISIICLGFLYMISENTPVELLFEYSKYTSEFDTAIFPMFIRIFHYISGFFVSSIILILMPKRKTIISFIGQNSIAMYLTHAAVIRILSKYNIILYSTTFNIILSEIIILAVCITITIFYDRIKMSLQNRAIYYK